MALWDAAYAFVMGKEKAIPRTPEQSAAWFKDAMNHVVVYTCVLAVFVIALALARVAITGQPLIDNYQAGPTAGAGTIPGQGRFVRSENIGSGAAVEHVVCVEPPRTTVTRPADDKTAQLPGVSSTLMVRETSWQLCNAYASGVITKADYAKNLLEMLAKTQP